MSSAQDDPRQSSGCTEGLSVVSAVQHPGAAGLVDSVASYLVVAEVGSGCMAVCQEQEGLVTT